MFIYIKSKFQYILRSLPLFLTSSMFMVLSLFVTYFVCVYVYPLIYWYNCTCSSYIYLFIFFTGFSIDWSTAAFVYAFVSKDFFFCNTSLFKYTYLLLKEVSNIYIIKKKQWLYTVTTKDQSPGGALMLHPLVHWAWVLCDFACRAPSFLYYCFVGEDILQLFLDSGILDSPSLLLVPLAIHFLFLSETFAFLGLFNIFFHLYYCPGLISF